MIGCIVIINNAFGDSLLKQHNAHLQSYIVVYK